MTTTEACTHEDCDCHICSDCGAFIPDGDEWETESLRYQIGDEWETETETFCPDCAAKREARLAAWKELPVPYEYDAEDEIPF